MIQKTLAKHVTLKRATCPLSSVCCVISDSFIETWLKCGAVGLDSYFARLVDVSRTAL